MFIALPSMTPRQTRRIGSFIDISGMTMRENRSECDGAISERGDRLAWLDEIGVGLRVECRTGCARGIHPLRKIRVGNGIGLEGHVGKTIAAELRRESRIASGIVRLKLKMRRHSSHGVDLAAELRHEEAVHDAGGRQLEADRRADRDDKMIDAGDALRRGR